MSQLATVKLVSGPAMLRDENGLLAGYVYVDVAGRDIGGYVTDAKRVIAEHVKLPPGYSLVVERTVRSDGARQGADEARAAGHGCSW